MDGFLRWFKSNSKMKRWLLLVVVGILLSGYGISLLLVEKELDFSQLFRIIITFVLGFSAVILGIIFIQKRTLELLVEDTIEERKTDNVNSLIFNKKVYTSGPKVVVIGGGSGLNTVLAGLKKYTDNITAIVTVSDYGEEISDSRKILNSVPSEDIVDGFTALSKNDVLMDALMNYKFSSGYLKNIAFKDIYLLAMNELYGDMSKAVEASSDILNITGRVIPATLEEINITTELEDGTVIKNRKDIPEVISNKVSKINRIVISPATCRSAPGVVEAIQEADAIVIGPGSLYTNILPNLLVRDVTKAIRESRAFKIYISNLMTEPGQTENYSLADHIEAIMSHVGTGIIDYCIYDTAEMVPEYVRMYNLKGYEPIEQDVSRAKELGVNMMQRNLSYIDGDCIHHNPDLVAQAIMELICNDLKFQDRQNDAQYMALNNRLKDSKKKNRHAKKRKPVGKQKNEQRNSKFYSKYKDRIESIKESDIKIVEKEKLQAKMQKENEEKRKAQLRAQKNLEEDLMNSKLISNENLLEEALENNKQNKKANTNKKTKKTTKRKTTKKKVTEKEKREVANLLDKLRGGGK